MELYVQVCPPPPQPCTTDSANMEYSSANHRGNLSTNFTWDLELAHPSEPANLTTPADPGASQELTPCGVFFFVVYGPLFGLVCLLGLIGNSLSFAVLHKYSRSNVATYLLKALAVSDNIFLATASFVQMYPAMSMYFGLIAQYEPLYPYFQTYVWPLTHIVQMGTVYMMVLVAGNRYIAVCMPLQAPRLCTKRNVQIQILVMTIGIVIYNIPRFFEFRYNYYNVTLDNNVTVLQEENLGLASIRLYNILYENVAYCIFVFLLPLLILIIFNAHLVRDLKKAQRSRKAMTSRSSMEENNITLVMIIIIIVFIICQTPASINQILYYIIGESSGGCTHYRKYSHISNLLITMNSSMNFVIYCMFRRQFQQELIALMCHGRKGSRPLRRTIVLRAMHEPGKSGGERSSSGGKAEYASFRTDYTTVGAGVCGSSMRNMEDVPLRRAEISSQRSASPGAQSHDTTTSHLSHCNGREPMLA